MGYKNRRMYAPEDNTIVVTLRPLHIVILGILLALVMGFLTGGMITLLQLI